MRTVREIKLAIEEAHGEITLEPGELFALVREIEDLSDALSEAWHDSNARNLDD